MVFSLLRRRREPQTVEPLTRRALQYQLRRNPNQKFELIQPILQRHDVNSALDVGCNAGVITRLIGKAGVFAVGIDYKVETFGIEDPLKDACLGKVQFDLEVAERLPTFDAILLLSVYHQWVRTLGDEASRAMLCALARKTAKVLIIELSGRAMKYGYGAGEYFTDHDDESVVNYWRDYLGVALPALETIYIGKAWEKKSEPFRYLFTCSCRRPQSD